MKYVIKGALETGGNPKNFNWSDAYADEIEFSAASDEEALQKAEAFQEEYDAEAERLCRESGESINVVWEHAPCYSANLYAVLDDEDGYRHVEA